jgi:tripartite-type tricarboxylate transporter receptor subunit TctC
MLGRRQLIGGWLGLATFGTAAMRAHAQDYPARPIRLVVAAAPGGTLDLQARIIGAKLGEALRQPVIVENRPGASGIVAAEFVAKATPDGYTILWEASDFVTVSSLMPQMSIDPGSALLPVAMVSDSPLAIVARYSAPFSTMKELVAAARSDPAGLTYATYGIATSNNVVGQWLAAATHIKLTHVPYHSGPAAVQGVMAGSVDLAIVAPANVYPSLTQANKVKVIALTGARHPSYLPPWPTLPASGLPIDATIFTGLFAPAGMSAVITQRLDEAMNTSLKDHSVRERLVNIGFEPRYLPAGEFANRIRADKARYDQIIRSVGMKKDQ